MKRKQKIFYVFAGRFPCEIAISLFAAKSAESFSNTDYPSIILAPRRFRRSKERASDFYQTKNNYDVAFLPCIDLFQVPLLKRIAHHIVITTFTLSSLVYLLVKAKSDDIIYSNAHIPLFLLTFFFRNTFYEVHDFPEKKTGLYTSFFQRCRWILITNQWKEQKLIKKFKVSKEKIIYTPNAVDLQNFSIPISQKEARQKLGLQENRKIILYTGHLFSWKGVDTLGQAANLLSEVEIHIVGGNEPHLTQFKKKYGSNSNLKIWGFRHHQEIPYWQKAADLLILPNTAKEKISKYYTSPMKLFEYMASGTPIIASNIPSITEIATEENCFLFEPDNSENLTQTIKEALQNPEQALQKATQALTDVQQYTWDKRARKILKHIEKSFLEQSQSIL